MGRQTIEVEGFEIELAAEHFCDRGGDHLAFVRSPALLRQQMWKSPALASTPLLADTAASGASAPAVGVAGSHYRTGAPEIEGGGE